MIIDKSFSVINENAITRPKLSVEADKKVPHFSTSRKSRLNEEN